MKKIQIIDGNNQFFLNMSRALNATDLARRCFELHNNFDVVYWIFDGMDSRKPRRDLYPDYKNTASRQKNNKDQGRYDLLNNFKRKDLPERGGVIVIEIPFFEADDIIRKLIMHHACEDCLITISSNDVDLLDLTKYKGVTQPQAKMPSVCQNPAQIPIYKALVGDSGDNIKGLKGFGEAAWEKLSAGDLQLITSLLINKIPITEDSVFDDEKLKTKLIENWDNVCLWYKLVDYIEVPDDLIQQHLKIYPKKVLQSGLNQNLTMG